MANPFDTFNTIDYDNQGDLQVIKEGLLCPVCLQDFTRIQQLEEHFSAAHPAEVARGQSASGGKDLSSQLKGFFGKAKKRIGLKDDGFQGRANDVVDEAGSSRQQQPQQQQQIQYNVVGSEDQGLGQTRSHFNHLKQIRDRRVERYVVETNKLLIRLDKLVSDAPNEPEKRKQHEQNVVFWVSDKDVKLCPNCAKSFNLSRRRHHCRLCGGIMCHNCSLFLDFEYARKLITPTNLEDDSIESRPGLAAGGGYGSGGSSQRRGSTSSLMSIVNASGDPHIRVCRDCKVLLDRRDQQIEDQRFKPIVSHLYDRLKQAMNEADKLTPIYYNMSYSFSVGESNYNLRDAQDLRLKLMKLAEVIDSMSRKIAVLGADDSPAPSSPQISIQNKLRLAATLYLRENMMGLPSLPSLEELEKLQEQRQLEIQRRIQMERQQALEEQEQARRSLTSSPSPSRKVGASGAGQSGASSSSTITRSLETVTPNTGWGPELEGKQTRNHVASDMDPMLLQINRVKKYIKQARDEHKYDEVHMLEANLRELEIEFFLQQQEDGDKHEANHRQS